MTEIRLVKGCCPLDCQDTCAWVAEVVDGRVQRVRGAREHPYTRGVLCAKVNDYEQRTYAPDRLLYPLRRRGPRDGGAFERISWDEALDTIAERFQQIMTAWGPQALLPHHYAGSMGAIQRHALTRLFHLLGASRQGGNLCAGGLADGCSALGLDVRLDPESAAEARLMILWGSNMLSTHHHAWHFIEQARHAHGARVIAIDPRPTRTTARADLHLPIKINSDLYLALALGHVILAEGLEDREFLAQQTSGLEHYRQLAADWTPERVAPLTGIDAETIVGLARDFAAARPAAIRLGVNPTASSAGSSMTQAVVALTMLCGHWRFPGGGFHYGSNPGHNAARVAGLHLAPSEARVLNLGSFGETLTSPTLDPPIKGLMVWGTNPVLVQPNAALVRQGLAREDLFTVVLEHFMTDTARYAELVLPSTTQLEHFDVLGSWGHQYMSANLPAIAPLGESRSHGWIARELSRRLGLPTFSDEELAREFMPEGMPLEQLLERGWIKVERQQRLPRVRLDFTPREPLRPPAEYPLTLISPKSHYSLNSSLINQPRQQRAEGRPTLQMSPADAHARGLVDGTWVRIWNQRGATRACLQVTERMQPGVVVLPGRWWRQQLGATLPLNELTPGTVSGASGQPAYNDCFVQVGPEVL